MTGRRPFPGLFRGGILLLVAVAGVVAVTGRGWGPAAAGVSVAAFPGEPPDLSPWVPARGPVGKGPVPRALGEGPGSSAEPIPSPALQEHPGAVLTVSLMTIGQGDRIWERFGHNAIWIRNERTGEELAYNWGMFHFGQVDFVPRLIQGTMRYWMAPRDPSESLAENRFFNRPVWVQELALTPQERLELLSFVEWNARPENAYYTYDYYRDNCSTRVRDALDGVLGGRIRDLAQADTTSRTYRWHTRRLLQSVPAAYAGIQWVLGPSADRPLTAWEEGFLPQRLRETVRQVRVPDGEGGLRSLVVEERQVLPSTRPPEPSAPPFALPWFLLAGLLWGGGMFALARKGLPLELPRAWGLAFLAGGWALTASVAGSLILGAWLFTDHRFWYRNLNLLQANPLFIPLALLFFLLPLRRSLPRWGRDLAAGLGVVAGVGLLAPWLPGVGQQNGEILAFTLPLNAAMVVTAFLLGREPGPGTSPEASGGPGESPPGGTR